MRVGTGFDLHRLGAERPLKLAGVEIPGSPGLIAHSDGDVVLHALADAVLGAAGSAHDIGTLFPDDDPEWKGADSSQLLLRVLALVGAEWSIVNADCTVLCEAPKLSPYRDAMRASLAGVLGIAGTAVGVKFTTMEGLGPIGRGEAIACQAVVLLEPGEELQ